MIKVKLERSYRSKKGNVTFVYNVDASAESLEQYKIAQGEFFRESDKGVALWFTTKCIGETGSLIITSKGKVVPDMSEFDKMASIVEQYGGNFGQALANQAVGALLGTAPAPAPQAQIPAPSVPVEEAQADDLKDL